MMKRWFKGFRKSKGQEENISSLAPTALDYPLVVYLDEEALVALAASMEGSISRLSILSTTTSSESLTGKSIDSDIKIISAGIHGKKDNISRHGELKSESITKEIPLSAIFVNLRRELKKAGVVRNILDENNIIQIDTGDFVECQIVLKRNTIMEKFDQIKSSADLLTSAGPLLSTIMENQQTTIPKQLPMEIENDTKAVTDLFESAFITDDYDWHYKIGNISIMFTSKTSCFSRSLDEIIEGTFHLFGKVSRVIPIDSDEKIDLLRNTSIGKFSSMAPDINNNIQEVLSSISDTDEIVSTKIGGPAIQIIPIAIYV